MQLPADATASELGEILAQLGVIVAGDPSAREPRQLYEAVQAQGLTDEQIVAEVEEQRAR